MVENCIPNWILHGEIKAGCHKQGILTQENFQRRAQEQPTQVWSIDLCNWEKYDQHASTNISEKLGKNRVKRAIQEKKKQNLLNYIYIYIYIRIEATHL